MPIKPYIPQKLAGFEDQRELVRVLRDVLLAHKGYYEAGFLHGNISDQTVMRVPDETQPNTTKGVLLDLDDAYNRKPIQRPPPPQSGVTQREEAEKKDNTPMEGVETTAKSGNEQDVAEGESKGAEPSMGIQREHTPSVPRQSDQVLKKGMRRWLASS